jgi:oxygen-independent coproporphyrinogen-3 oxidase
MDTAFGVYVHVPYCRVQCPYCTFFTAPRPAAAPPMSRFLAALAHEWRLRVQPRLGRGDRLRTLYLGGGTPSDLPPAALAMFLDTIAADVHGGLGALDEVTVECNPESATPALLDALAARGVGRVSLGVQSLDDRDLAALGRGGTAADVRRALAEVASRFPTWSADLILGIPASEPARLEASVDALVTAGAPHLSFYCLELPPERARRLGDPQTEDSEAAKAALYEWTSAAVEARGYVHYEISSAARPGHTARHNSSYWTGADYVGLGPGAHSFAAGVRRANRSDLPAYLGALASGHEPPASRETVTPTMRRDERLLVGLRRREGVPVDALGAAQRLVAPLQAAGLARPDADRLRLTPRGWLISDTIVLQLVAAMGLDPGRIDNEIGASLDLPV